MSENGNENNGRYEMRFVDKAIVGLICGASIIVIIVTIILVNHKYQKLYEDQLAKLNEIPYNETYKYLLEDNTLKFYVGTKEVSKYKCERDCKIADFSSSQFIIDNDDLIPIMDHNSMNLFSISNKETTLVLDEVPQTSINNQYGIIKINDKYGVINKKGKIILNCIYDDVDINFSHIVTLSNYTVNVFDNDAVFLVSKGIDVNGDISISEKNNYLYINIVGNKTTTLIFDVKTNRFINE